MGLENLGQLKVAGALVVAIASFGFLVWDARYADKINGNFEAKWSLKNPSSESTLYPCALALAVLGALVVVALLGGIVVTLLGLGLPPMVVVGLFGGGAVLFLGVIIAAAVGVSAASYSIDRRYYLLDSRSLNESEDTRSYVNAYKLYQQTAGRAKGFSGFAGNKTARAAAASSEDQEYCFNRYGSLLEGTSFGGWEYMISRLPLANDLVFAVQPTAYPTGAPSPTMPPYVPDIDVSGRELYTASGVRLPSTVAERDNVPACYGIQYDLASAIDVVLKEDLCLLEVSDAKCAPGWAPADVGKYLCDAYEYCLQSRKDDSSEVRSQDLSDVGVITRDASTYFGRNYYPIDSPLERLAASTAWVLPAGWDRLSDLRGYWKSESASSRNEELAMGSYGFYAFNLTFLVVGIVGWVFLILGLVFGFLSGGGDDKD